jgi:maltose/moltooligosaccharide transporter
MQQAHTGDRAPFTEATAEATLPGVDDAEEGALDVGMAMQYSVANIGAQSVYTMFLTAIPRYLESYGLSTSLIGFLSQERSLVAAFVQPVVGRVSDRTRTPLGRRRPFFLVGIPLMSIALMILAARPDVWVVIGLLTFAAFFLSIAWDPYLALLGDLFPASQRGRVGGFLGLANGIGAILFLMLALFLWQQSEALVFFLVIAILVATFGFTFLTVKEPPAPPVEERKKIRPNPIGYMRDLLAYPEAAKFVLALSLFWIGSGGAAPFITLFAEHALGAQGGDAFLLPIMFTVSTALFSIPAGYLADRIGKKWVVTAGLLVYGLAAAIGSQSPTLLIGIVALGIVGIGNAGVTIQVPMLTDLVPGRRMAELLGVATAIFAIAQPIGSVVAGAIRDAMAGVVGDNDAYRWTFLFAGTMIVLSALVLQTVRPPQTARRAGKA